MTAQPPAPSGVTATEPSDGSRQTIRRATESVRLTGNAAAGALTGFVLLSLVAGGLPVTAAWLTKLLLDGIAAGAAPGRLVELGVALAGVGLVAGAVPQLTEYLRTELAREVGLLAHARLYAAVDRFVGMRRFEDPRFLDRLRLAQQAGGTTPSQVVDGALGIARAVVTILGFLGSLLLLSPVMAALVLVAAAPTVLAELKLARRRAEVYQAIGPAERRELFYGNLLSSLDAVKEIRLFGTGAFLLSRMLSDRRTANRARRTVDRREALVQGGLGLLAAVVAGAGLLWAVTAARRGQITVGDVTIFVAAVAGTQGSLAVLAGDLARTHHALLMFDHYLAVTTAPPDLPVATAPRPLPPLRDGIELRDVWFRYSDQHPWVLRGITLRIRRGDTVAVVGRNGAGKSTLVKLLCRFYDPVRGTILWDGVDIRDVDPRELRRRIGAVFQDYMEYDLSAAENIGLGDLTALDDPARIRSAAVRAGIDDTLTRLPHGYETLLSRRFFAQTEEDGDPSAGVLLSGGQWQRVALARALLRDKQDFMILDEPSAGLDAEAEHEIHLSLRRYRAGRTSLLISHRLGSVRDADRIIVLSQGRVVEAGEHHGLLAADGEYARLFTLQASGYRTEARKEAGDRPAALAE
ncbi:ABC transporter ATP-binding protein [Micromonospora sp. NPDC047557]|uniref:ABC transporter ATP-binding protein n=1 Tax=Micromonospora sp. NPDC047557 TaxID=3364250 RepID=UPI00370FD19B